jgi:transcriptional regulator with XRE-family HTH domain
MNPQDTFVARLRRARQRRGVSLDEIATRIRVKPELLDAFERNDLTDWPKGLYSRAWVRGYAEAVGLDPVDTVDEFCRLYLHGDRRARSTMREMAGIASTDSEYRDEYGGEERRQGERRAVDSATRRGHSVWHAWRVLRARIATLWVMLFTRPGRAEGRSGAMGDW